MRLDPEDWRLVTALAQQLGVNRSDAVRYALRHTAAANGIPSDVPLLEGLRAKPGPRPKRQSD